MTGRTILHYRVLEKLGEGGMGAVYKARDTRLDRLVAIKVLPSTKIADEDLKRRLIREARAASALNHPNIITIYEIETVELDGQPVDFIVMEYVAGKTLEQLIGAHPLPAVRAINYSIQIAAALTAAHEAGIVHRDLKPSNIMVTDAGFVKVLDFGLAKLTEPQLGADADLTRTILAQTGPAGLLGTAAYMSPEQVEGHPADARSDIFSFGSTLYEMMTGQRAFQRQTITSTIVAVLRDEPASSTSSGQAFPPQLHHIVSLCLKKEPSRRIQHMVDVKLELEELQGGRGGNSSGTQWASLPTRLRRRWLWSAAGALGAIAAGFGVYAIARYRQPAKADIKVIALTTYPGLERYPALSPDGKEIAFSWNGPEQDHSDIYVKLVAGGEPLRLTDNADEDTMPSWSPDGERIAFARGNSIVQMSSLGGTPRKVLELGDMPFGHQIAWTRDGSSLILPDAKNDEDPYSLWTYDIEESKERKLTSPPQWTVGDADPAVSHGGGRIAFARWFTTSSADVFISDADGRRLQRLTHDNSQIQGLTWTPDDREVVFSSNRDGTFRIWRVRASGASGATPRRIAEAGPNAVSPVIAAGPSQRLVCARIVYDFDIGRIDLPTKAKEVRSGLDIIASTRTDDSPRFSPDGSKVAFVSDRTGSQEIWVSNSDGSHQMQLTFMNCPSGSPHWSPDGRSIVFDSLVAGNKDLFLIAADGGSPHRLTEDKYQEWRPSYSRDGNWIYFGSDRSHSPQIWKLPSSGGTAVQITGNGGYEAAESPDGKTLYYTKSRYRTGLWRTPLDRQAESSVLPNVSTGFWDVEDRGIYFLDMTKATANGVALKLYTPPSGQTTDLAMADKASSSGTPGLSVLRDGRSVLYVRAEQFDSELLMLDNFR